MTGQTAGWLHRGARNRTVGPLRGVHRAEPPMARLSRPSLGYLLPRIDVT
jgi:hypothetical protein